MDFMGFHSVDITIIALILFLSIKGFISGFSKELLNFITIIGGITLAAHFNTTVVNLINEQHILPMITENYAKIVGFVVIILTIWIVISVISAIINRFSSETISPLSRIFGYIISAARYFIIFALIVFGTNQFEPFKSKVQKLNTETKLFTPMTKIGATVLNMDLNNTVKENNCSNVVLTNHKEKEIENTEKEVKEKEVNDINSSETNSSKENLTSTDENLSTEHNTTD